MAPKKELCRNFARGSCQYGDRCKFLHVTPQQSKQNPFGFGVQAGNQFQHSSVPQQKANPFGFGVKNNSQSSGTNEFGSKQNQFQPFQNKWTRSSPATAAATSRQPDNQAVASSHNCTDPESCKRQILEDFEQERPLWRLTCYGHYKNAPCDIVGDISYEELRVNAYDDAKRGLSLQSIVERERSLLNSKLLEFESLHRNPYKGPHSVSLGLQSSIPGGTQNVPSTAQSSNPPFSSFSQLGPSVNTGNAATSVFSQFQNPNQSSSMFQMNTSPFGKAGQTNHNNIQASGMFQMNNSPFGKAGQSHIQNTSQTSGMFQMNDSPFGKPDQLTSPTVQSPFASGFTAFSNSSVSAEQNQFSTSRMPSYPALSNGFNAHANGVGLSLDIDLRSDVPNVKNDGDDTIWTKNDWKIGEIPEEAPPDKYCW